MVHFGTGGFRGIIGDEFTKENIEIISKALCEKMINEGVEKEIVMGYDKRFLSKEAMQWAAQVFAAEGFRAYLINRSCPTPLVMYYVMEHRMDYGMMITASHNPAIYNGIKVFTKGGRDANEETTIDLEKYMAKVDENSIKTMEYDKAKELGLIEEIYPLNDYIDAILDAVDVQAIRKAGLRVAIDPMYGVSETSLKTILMTTRCEVFTIHDRHDTLFGGKLPAPNSSTLKSLQNAVLDNGCDIGLATDGDADRIGIIDDKGRFLHPNDILVLLYYYLVKFKGWNGPVVRNLTTTHMLDKVADQFGQKCYEVPVGFKWVSSKMSETDAIIGGESSGGLTVKGHIHGKDGIYAAALLVEMLALTGKKLSQIYKEIEDEVGSIYMEERDFKFSQEKKESINKVLMEEKQIPSFDQEIEKVSYMDGCKVYFKNGGWISARFSGTEPLLRIYSEMPTPEAAIKEAEIFQSFLAV
ncbi:MAG: phosphoglucomutase/phosphomannomutase family protein [Pseudobutyrivibrio sp.]|nr:phosphoglucomutase/phosphomannomutase family protein [Pseudobutyrivibrio sp.]